MTQQTAIFGLIAFGLGGTMLIAVAFVSVMDSARGAADRVASWSPAKQDYARRVTEGRGQ